MTKDHELERQLRAMRPCPKCGEPVHPENTGFHVCRTSKTIVQQLEALKNPYWTHYNDGWNQALNKAIELIRQDETTAERAAPDAWLFHCWKPGTHMTFASIQQQDNSWWPTDQWKGVTREPLFSRGAPDLIYGEWPPSERVAVEPKRKRLRDSEAAFNLGVLPTEQPEKATTVISEKP